MKRSSLFVSIILCLALLLSLGATGVFAAEEGQEAAFVKNWGMTLNDEIVLKFEMGEIPASATEIKATVGGHTYTAPASQQIVSVPVYATQMTEAVTLTAVDGNGESVASRSFTVLTYLQSVLDNALFASYHPLVKELLNYGSAAQLHFIGSSDITVSGAGQTAIPTSGSAYAIDDQSDLLNCTGASLVYREKIALRFYFNIDPTGCTFAVNGEAADLTVNEAGKYVEIADILPQNLDQQVVLSVTDAEGRAVSVTYSPLTYIVRMSQKGSDTTKALVKALYNYHLAAKAFVPLQDFVVSFNLGYNGEAIADRTIAVGDPYGQLPTPADRVGYTFGGWYTDAACTGEAVTAETLVTSSHTLYAKWGIEPDTNPVVLEDNVNYNPYNAKLTHDVVDGKHVYTYTTKGVASPTTEPWSRRLNVYGWEAGTKYVAIEFRYTEAFKADGVTPIENIGLGVYTGTSGVGSPKIHDATGKQVAFGNATSGLAVGQWYTVIVEPGSLTGFSLWTCHGYTADAAVITMEIRNRQTCNADVKVTTPGAMADAGMLWNETDGWHWFVYNNENSINADQRYANIVVTKDGAIGLEYEVKFNSLSGDAAAYVGLMQGVNTFYDLETGALVGKSNSARLEIGKWYRVVYKTNNAANMGTSAWTFGYIGGFGAGNASVSMRNFEALYPAQYTVSFNVNYAGGEAINAIRVEQDTAYGTLPTPAEREGYIFGGWTLADGTAVNADTKVTASHTLYAKWILPEDTNVVKVGSVTDGSISRDIVDGKNVYTYTTKGMTTHGGNPKRKVNISFPAGQNYVAVEFRFTESKTAAGADRAPYLRVYDQTNSGNGGAYIETIWIQDANGKEIARNNAETGLNIGQWYTVIVKMKTGTQFNMCALSHYATDVPLVTMEIRDRGTYAVPGNLETAWGDFPEPTLHFADGKFQYDLIGSAASVPGEHRQLNLTLSTDGMTHVMYEVMVENPTGGASATITSGNTVFYDLETGMKVTSFEEGKWYGATYTTGSNLGTSRLNLGYTGSSGATAGGIDVHIRNLRAFAADTNAVGPIAAETYWGTLYRTDASTYRWATTNAVSGGSEAADWQRKISFKNPLTAAAVIKVDFKFLNSKDASGNDVTPNMYAVDGSTISAQTSEFVVVDAATGKVASALEVGKNYSIYVTADANSTVSLVVGQKVAAGYRASVEITGCEAIEYTAPTVKMAPNSTAYCNMGLYKSGDEWVFGYAHSTGIHTASTDYRKIQVYLGGTTYTQLQFAFKYQEATNNGAHVSAMNLSTGTLAITDLKGNAVATNSMEADTWYIATISAASGSTLPNNFQIYTMGWSIAGSAESPIHIKMVIKDLQAN